MGRIAWRPAQTSDVLQEAGIFKPPWTALRVRTDRSRPEVGVRYRKRSLKCARTRAMDDCGRMTAARRPSGWSALLLCLSAIACADEGRGQGRELDRSKQLS